MDVTSLWNGITTRKEKYPALDTIISVDVAIIGGGITGTTAALLLSQQGKKVAVLEAAEIGSGTTGNSTGNLYVLIQPYYQKIQSRYGEKVAKLIIDGRLRAIDFIEQIVKSYQFQCNFLRRPSYLLTNEDKNFSFLEKEIDILKTAGVRCEEVTQLDTSIPFKKAFKIFNQARVNPLAYSIELANVLTKQGVSIYENTQVLSVEEKDDQTMVKTDHGTVLAKKVFMATHIPKGITMAPLLAPPYRSYAVATRIGKKIASSGHYWEVNEPHYVLSTHCSSLDSNEDDLMVIAGNHHKTGHDKDAVENFAKLEHYLRQHYDVESVEYQWSAQHYQSADGLPYIGKLSDAKHLYIATGFYADGLVYGTLAAQLISDLILEKPNDLSHHLAPYRLIQPSSIATLAKEGIDACVHYAMDYASSPEVSNLQEIAKGDGRSIKINGERCGAYRDQDGRLHVVSIICTHMKCILKWNNAETSWDCPCHGSRFTYEGEVIEGPAYLNLKKIDLPES